MRAIAFSILMFLTTVTYAQTTAPTDHESHHPAANDNQGAAADFTTGEVRRVDREARKVTLRHGPIANLGMPEMTMVFRVDDPKLLDNLKTGDKVRFKADKVEGQYTVTEMEAVQ